jgi:hypothetical protein
MGDFLKSGDAAEFALKSELEKYLANDVVNFDEFALKKDLESYLKTENLDEKLPGYLKELKGKQFLGQDFEAVIDKIQSSMAENDEKYAKVSELKDWLTKDSLD